MDHALASRPLPALFGIVPLLAACALALALGAPADSGHRATSDAESPGALRSGQNTEIDIAGVIEKVHHRVASAHPQTSVLIAEDPLYRASFDERGFALALKGVGQDGLVPRVRIETTALARGDSVLALSAGQWSGKENRAVRTLAPGVTERVTARDSHVEWDFVLARPLAGAGDLTLRARLHGAGVARRVGEMWRLPVAKGRAVTMGALVVKDARGQELHRALPQVGPGGVSLTVPAHVLARAAYPLTIDPVISPEHAASDPVSAAAQSEQQEAALAWDGTNYLVVWADRRSNQDYDLYGARVSAAGALLDPTGIAISTALYDQMTPSLAWDGANYLVVWADGRSSGGPNDIYGARVSSAGAVLDANGIPISAAAAVQRAPALAWDGTNYLVAWEDHRSGTSGDVYAARVSTAGSVLDASGVAVSSAANDQRAPAVAWDGTNYMVAWHDDRSGVDTDVYAARVDASASVLDAGGIAVSTAAGAQEASALAWDGTNYLITWHDYRSGPDPDIYAARVNAAGLLQDASGIAISTAANAQFDPSVAWDGTNHLVAWDDLRSGTNSDIYVARVGTDGTVLDAGGIAVSTAANDQWFAAVAWDGNNFLVAWEDNRSGSSSEWDVRAARVSSDGGVQDGNGFRVSSATNRQAAAAVAWDGTNYLVVWEDFRSDTDYDIYAARLTAAGTPLDGTGIPISTAAGDQRLPAVAWNGSTFLVVWQDGDLRGARVSSAGTVADPGGIAISTAANAQQFAAVAANGTGFFVAWEDTRAGGPPDIYGAPVDGAGTVGGEIAISTAIQAQVSPSLAWNGSEYLVAWSDNRLSSNLDIYGQRVDAAGTSLVGGEIAVSTAAQHQQAVEIASDGSDFLLVWLDSRAPTYDIYGTRVDGAGNVLEPAGLAISTVPPNQAAPSVAWDGANYVVIWPYDNGGLADTYDLYAARVSTAGAVVDASPIAVAASGTDETQPRLAAGPAGRTAAVYGRVGSEAGGAYRVFLRFFDDDRTPPVNPSLASTSHTARVWSADETVDVGWSGASDAVSGVDGFSYEWDTLATTVPDEVKDAEEDASGFTSPDLADGDLHYVHLRARDNAGNWSDAAHLGPFWIDTVAPMRPSLGAALERRFQTRKSFVVSWLGAGDGGSGVESYEVQVKSARWSAGFGSYAVWKSAATRTAATFAGRPGRTYCFRARARDGADNLSAWSRTRCTAVPLDDRALAATGPWLRKAGTGYYLGTRSLSWVPGAALMKTGVRARRLAVVVTRSPDCGQIKVYWRGRLVRVITLTTAVTKKKQVVRVASFDTARSGKVTIVAASSTRAACVEGLGVSGA